MFVPLRQLAQIVIDRDNELDALPKGQVDNTTVAVVLELAFATLGSVAFIMMVVAGIKYSSSRGNSDAIAKARNTIVYSGIGLILAILSFAIVRFVVRNLV